MVRTHFGKSKSITDIIFELPTPDVFFILCIIEIVLMFHVHFNAGTLSPPAAKFGNTMKVMGFSIVLCTVTSIYENCPPSNPKVPSEPHDFKFIVYCGIKIQRTVDYIYLSGKPLLSKKVDAQKILANSKQFLKVIPCQGTSLFTLFRTGE